MCECADMLTYTAVSGSQSLVSDCLSSLVLFLRHSLSLNLKLTGSQVGLDCLGNELLLSPSPRAGVAGMYAIYGFYMGTGDMTSVLQPEHCGRQDTETGM